MFTPLDRPRVSMHYPLSVLSVYFNDLIHLHLRDYVAPLHSASLLESLAEPPSDILARLRSVSGALVVK